MPPILKVPLYVRIFGIILLLAVIGVIATNLDETKRITAPLLARRDMR